MSTIDNSNKHSRNTAKDAVFYINCVIIHPTTGAEIPVRAGIPIGNYYGADKALVNKFTGADLEGIVLNMKGTVRSAVPVAPTAIEGDLW